MAYDAPTAHLLNMISCGFGLQAMFQLTGFLVDITYELCYESLRVTQCSLSFAKNKYVYKRSKPGLLQQNDISGAVCSMTEPPSMSSSMHLASLLGSRFTSETILHVQRDFLAILAMHFRASAPQ